MPYRNALRLALGLPFLLAATSSFAQQNPYSEACKLFGGSYEERRVGCDPECEITYICRFPDGSGRICDGDGGCGPLVPAAPQAALTEPVPEAPAPTPLPESAAAAAVDPCEARCSGLKPKKAANCRQECLDEQQPAAASDSASDQAAAVEAPTRSASSLCESCLDECRSECSDDLTPRQKRICEAGCDHTCERECEG